MKHLKYALFFFLFILQQAIVLGQETELSSSNADTMDISSTNVKKYSYTYTDLDISTNKILHITSTPSDLSYPGFIYASFEANPDEETRMFSSQEYGTNEIHIDLSKYAGKTKLYILVKAIGTKPSTNIAITTLLSQNIELNSNRKKAKFILSHNPPIQYTVPSTLTFKKILLYVLGESSKFFKMEIHIGSIILNAEQIFENGYGALVDLNSHSGQTINLVITSETSKETKVEVGFEMIEQETTYKREVSILEHVYGATSSKKNCYTMKENIDISKRPILLINAFSQAVSFRVFLNNGTKLYSQDGLHNSYIRLLQSFNKDNHYFCIHRYIPKDTNESSLNGLFGKASYDFQLYYEDELQSNQMRIMPLINGKIYSHSLNRSKIMVYRHNSYPADESGDKIYSANLLKIRGNPKLYGFICNTYPNCVVASNSDLEEVEKINQYFVNKRKDATGNTARNANGESVSEERKQYMSVVICDTEESDPNYGECKYTIEINNEVDEIQLLPEKVFSTSLLTGTNKFYVRISNYDDDVINKLNITLTVLSGNAVMKIYSDSSRTTEITPYNHHKVFRREVFEFEGTYSGAISENYYGVIICSEPSFVELSYLTSFHFKGYIMTNPGEVNIEYINKRGSQFPYEILNPYIYIPLDANINKNKDYMFKIRSKECSMFYNYNYNDMPKTRSVNMQFDRTQPYTYLTSFAFMTTVDSYDYNYNNLGGSDDCAMLVYSGEIDSPERPLLIVSDVALASDINNTNFIYPFIKNNEFKGIMVDIRLADSNNGSPSYKVNLSVKGTNVLDEATINKDTSFFIASDNNRINCGNNMQCALKIQIIKQTELNKTHQITVNVYSPSPKLPEIIEKTITQGNIYIPEGGFKIIQTSIGNNEGTEFIFDFGTETGTVSARLVPKNQVNTINDYSNINIGTNIDYTPATNKLTLSHAQTSNCNLGCELIIKIGTDNNGNNVKTVSFTMTHLPLEIVPDGGPFTFNLYPLNHLYEKMFTYTYTTLGENHILYLSVRPEIFGNTGFIYASFDENVSEDNRLFSSHELGSSELYIDLSKYGNNKKLYILVKAHKKEIINTITVEAKLIKKVELSSSYSKAKFKLSHNSKVYYKVPNPITINTILLYALGEDWNCFDVKAVYTTSGRIERNLYMKNMFNNGYGVVVDLSKVGVGKEITIELTPKSDSDKERKVEVGFEYADQDVDLKRPVNILEHVYGATSFSENCYEMTENIEIDKNPVLLINAFTQAVSFVVRKKNTHSKVYSQDGLHNSFIRLLQTFNKDQDYFCIKKYTPKDRTIEELGESSYDFQFYYENDLPNNQMFIMPLINGKIYTHSLNRGSIMIYRNSIFSSNSNSNTNKIYSANLLKIRGNPRLYGYVCETYPYCSVTKDTPGLEEVGVINQYSIHKRENVIGNNAIDTKGEAVSELRKQYVSVVICDTEESDPNYGECKYAIEINNEKDDIQLLPERVFATSLLPGINYFSVRVSNYQDVNKMNISLTVLTGNAFMNVYSDSDRTRKISDYNYHKIFRREVFEFSGSNMRENYWGVINCTEPAFIELKYVTSFHFKGYIMTNPGEVNIEYINKKGSQFPYEILNPYIYIPLDANVNKNKDYMFKIRSTECTMFYNYNYNDMPKTRSVNMQFDRTQPYTYLTSFAFMTTVDNYTYNTRDDSTDCAMLVYSGEIDSPERPLLILSDFPLPSDFDNTYYVYPYIQKGFKGFKVEIKFTDSNLVRPSYIVKLTVNGQSVVDDKTITKNELITIESTNGKMNCGTNLQCALNITVKKNSESDKTYNLTINVVSGESTIPIPEVITPTENDVAKIIIPKGEKKMTTISVGKDEELEFKFDFSSGRGNVLAVLLTKEEARDVNNLNFDENSSNLLGYDASGRILRLTKQDTEKCDAGCELVILMSVSDTEDEFTEVSISKTSISSENKEGQKEDDGNKVDAWLTAVLVVVCVVAVAGALILVYFLVLRKKKLTNMSSPPIEESEKEIKNNNDMVSKDKERVINFNQ